MDSPYRRAHTDLFSPPAHALAWSYLHTGADAKAAHLLAGCVTGMHAPRGPKARGLKRLQLCAEVELLRGNIDRALDGLEQAIQAGWREHYYGQEGTRTGLRLRDHPRYRALMAKVKADVDRQRAEVRESSRKASRVARGAAARPTK